MRWSAIDRRARRTVPRQSLSDTGHKDAGLHNFYDPIVRQWIIRGRTWQFVPLRDEIKAHDRRRVLHDVPVAASEDPQA